MSEFKWRHFSGEIILQCVRWYCKYGISYRKLEEMMADLEWDEKGVLLRPTWPQEIIELMLKFDQYLVPDPTSE